MFKKSCFCGERTKNFKVDIGPAYMDVCCKAKGYNVNGKLDSEAQDDNNQDENMNNNDDESQEANEDIANGDEMSNEEAQASKSVDFDGMTAKALMEYCKQNEIKFSKRDTRKKLLAKIEEAQK